MSVDTQNQIYKLKYNNNYMDLLIKAYNKNLERIRELDVLIKKTYYEWD